MRKPRSSAFPLLIALLLPACRSAAPKAAAPGGPALPDQLRPLIGDVRVLKTKANARLVTIALNLRPVGECDLAVRVRSAAFEKDGARFSLETVGRPAIAGRREPPCSGIQPGIQLLLAGLSPSAADVATRADAVLQTPEDYLRANGVAFDLKAADSPREVASQDESAAGPERVLGLKVTAWPRLLLSVSPYSHDPSGRVRQESEVEFDAVVGTDGRLHEPRLRTALSQAHQELVLSTLARWRYEPARTKDGAVAARVVSRLAMRIY